MNKEIVNFYFINNINREILNSKILSEEDFRQLSTIDQIPDETEVNEYKLIELSDFFISLEDDAVKLEEELHLHAKKLLKENKVEEAWKTLLAFNNQ